MLLEEENLSDEELQEAFAAGLLKPGLNVPLEVRKHVNNVVGLKYKMEEIALKLPWIERLDLNVEPAPMAPEMYHEVLEEEKKNIVTLKPHMNNFQKSTPSLALNDFKREMLFHRQAQAALTEGIARLTAQGIPTQRPEDYLAEMAKSDAHMHKVRESLAAKQAGTQKAERISELRRQRKQSKQLQVENKLKQSKEKKQMLNEVKKFRKGVRKDLNFLDGDKRTSTTKSLMKRKYKDEKFGFGGKKRGSKRNTKESFEDFDGSMSGKGRKGAGRPMRGKSGGGMKPKAGKGQSTKGGKPRQAVKGAKQRPGKGRRIKAKGRR